jgi:hypothetical protein
MSDIIGTVMAVLMGVTGLAAAGILLFGLFESIWGLGAEVKRDLHVPAPRNIGNLAPHH